MARSHASRRRRRRRRALVAAASLLPAPALAATYDLSNQTLNVATAPYTTADTLNCSNVTFNSTPAGGALLAAVNLAANDTVNTAGGLTLAGALSGSATLTKSGTGPLTLAALSPSFTGPLTLNANGGTLRLGIESPLAGTGGTLTLGSSTTLDLNGFNSPGRTITYSGGNSVVNNNTAATSTLSSLPSSFATLSLGGAGTLNLASGFYSFASYTKVGTGALTLSSPSPGFGGSLTVSAGTLQLGMNAPLSATSSPSVSVSSGAALDLNGYASLGTSVYLSNGASLVNNNTVTPSTLPSLTPFTASGTLTLGGTGDINVTAKVASLAKTGTGTLSLSGTNTSFAGTLTLNDGTVRLNAPNAAGTSSGHFVLNSTAVYDGSSVTYTAAGTLDLNGYPAPAGSYSFGAATWLVNNNTSTLSTVGTNAVISGQPMFGGNGELIDNQPLGGTVYKLGLGILTLNYSGNLYATIRNYEGILRLGNAATNAYSTSTLFIYGPTSQVMVGDRYAALDLNGRASTPATVYLNNNSGIVNNNISAPATLDSATSLSSTFGVYPPFHLILGGDGTLNVTTTSSALTGRPLDKVGAGLLTLPSSFYTAGVFLRGGTLHAEQDAQLGGSTGTLSFLGGTLRVAPLYLAPKPSYTFTSAISVDPAGGTIEAQRDTTLTGAFSGAGALTKAGTATLTLSNSPSAAVDLAVAAGTLRFAPALAAVTVGSLAISPGATVDLRNTTLTTSTSYALLRQYLHDGLLASSSADAAHVLGCKDTNPGTYHIQLTLRGDANLDSVISADDYALLDRGCAKSVTSAHWTDGDFNYDGLIDQQDYLLIDTAYGQAQGFSPEFLSQRESRFGPAYVADLLAAVPEPSAVAYLTGTLPLMGRRRRRQ